MDDTGASPICTDLGLNSQELAINPSVPLVVADQAIQYGRWIAACGTDTGTNQPTYRDE
jgi:hypothetical protein